VVGKKPIHLMEAKDRDTVVKFRNQFIDIGAADKEETTALVAIGDPVTFAVSLERLQGDRLTSRAFDDKMGAFVVAQVLKEVRRRGGVAVDLYGVFTVQEEVGLKGAKVSAYALHPDIAIATDVTIPGDHPGVTKKEASVEMGKGPVLVLASASGRGLLSDARLVSWLRSAGDKAKIPYQLEVGDGGNTDASIINLVRDGIPSIPLSVPSRYIHSPVEVVDLKDVESTIDLLVEALKKRPKI